MRDSDATLIFNIGDLDGGTLQTVRFAQNLARPYLVVQLDEVTPEGAAKMIRMWLTDGKFSVLNVAGPREEKRPGIYACVAALLDACFKWVRRQKLGRMMIIEAVVANCSLRSR